MIREVMHRLMVEENTERRKDGREPLHKLPKPCDYFDLIGGTSTGGCAPLKLYICYTHVICILQDNCFNAWAS